MSGANSKIGGSMSLPMKASSVSLNIRKVKNATNFKAIS